MLTSEDGSSESYRYEMPKELSVEEQAEKLGEYLKQAFIKQFKQITL